MGSTKVRDRVTQRRGRVQIWMEGLMQWDLGGSAELVDLFGVPPLLLPPAKCRGDGLDRGWWGVGDARREEWRGRIGDRRRVEHV